MNTGKSGPRSAASRSGGLSDRRRLFLNQTIEEMKASDFVGGFGGCSETIVSQIGAFVHFLPVVMRLGVTFSGEPGQENGWQGDFETSSETSDVKTDPGNEGEPWRRRPGKRPSWGEDRRLRNRFSFLAAIVHEESQSFPRFRIETACFKNQAI
jgi:hypothetical protein